MEVGVRKLGHASLGAGPGAVWVGTCSRPKDSRQLGSLLPSWLYLDAVWGWVSDWISSPPSSSLLLDATWMSPEYFCWRIVVFSPTTSDPQCTPPHPELTGSPGIPRPSWRRHCCRNEVDPCRPRPHKHSHAPWARSLALAPAAAPAC